MKIDVMRRLQEDLYRYSIIEQTLEYMLVV